jgi:hypothetical protein
VAPFSIKPLLIYSLSSPALLKPNPQLLLMLKLKQELKPHPQLKLKLKPAILDYPRHGLGLALAVPHRDQATESSIGLRGRGMFGDPAASGCDRISSRPRHSLR